MRIGFFTDSFPPGTDGVSASAFETARELERRGHEVFIVAPKYPGYVEKNPRVTRIASVMIHRHPEIRMGVNLTDRNLRKTILGDFDIIHGHSGGFITFMGREVAREKNIPYVFTYHTLWNRYTHYFMKGKVVKPKTMEQVSRIFGNIVDYIIAPTPRVEKELRRYGVKKPISVIPSGIDVKKFGSSKPGYLRKLTATTNEPIALYVGRLGKEKSVDFLLTSFKHVLTEVPDAVLALVGDGVDRRALEAMAKKLGIEKNTRFLGAVAIGDMSRVYRDASVFVFASTSETQGLVVPEALASGVPAVVVNDPAFECLENGKNGYLVKKDENEFAQKVASIMKDSDLRKRLSENARESAKNLSIEKSVDRLEEVYFDLLDKYNVESVPRIMGENERSEKIYTAGVIFWLSTLLLRLYMFVFDSANTYPTLNLIGSSFYFWQAGVLLLLISGAIYLYKRTVSFEVLLAAGVGCALVANDIISVFISAPTMASFWSVLNIIPVAAAGLAAAILSKNDTKERPRFYINTRIQKHVNAPNPKVSVVIPAYNEGEFLEPTLKSLLNQTFKNFEIVVVDNNSSDNTAEVAARFGARVVTQKIKGVAAARQMGFDSARGEIIASTDADSIVPNDWVEKIAAAYDKNKKLSGFAGLNALYSGAVSARAAGRYLFPIFWKLDKWVSGGWNMAGFNMSVRKSAFDKIGGFDSTLAMGEDIDLSKKLRTVGEIGVDENLTVASSGRRYSEGLFEGLKSYAPWWISKNLLKEDKPFKFADVRSEKKEKSRFDFLVPSMFMVLITSVIFLLANARELF